MAATDAPLLDHGRMIARRMDVDAAEVAAQFRDRAGAIICLHQDPRTPHKKEAAIAGFGDVPAERSMEMTYVDGYVIPVPRKNLAAYMRLAKLGAKIWKDHGALEYRECVGDDLDVKFGMPFPKAIKTKPGETIVFSFIVYRSRAQRDKINARVMADPRIADAMKSMKMPFDCKRMLFGGFTTLVKA